MIERLLVEVPSVRSFLEVGSGQGALATLLARRYEYLGYEPDVESYDVAQKRLARLGFGSVVNAAVPEIADCAFDVVGAFEVLEHQPDDRAALTTWVRWVRPGGYLMLSVPAHPHRFGAADREVGHFRRYTRAGLAALLTSVGLVSLRIDIYGFPLGYGLEWTRNFIAARRASRHAGTLRERTAASGRWLQPHNRVAPLIWMATLPFQFVQRSFAEKDLGTGFVIRAQRPE